MKKLYIIAMRAKKLEKKRIWNNFALTSMEFFYTNGKSII